MDRTGSVILEKLRFKDNEHRLNKIKEIIPKGLYLYYTTIKSRKDGSLYITPPYLVDFDSVPESNDNKPSVSSVLHKCDICHKSFSTTYGLTNHKNAKHK